MSFTPVVSGAPMLHTDVQQIIDCLEGAAGSGQPIALTQLNDSANYALDVRNLDAGNGLLLRCRDSANTAILTVTKTLATLGKNLSIALGTITTATDALSITATWNAAGETFTGIKMLITNTASAAASLLIDLRTTAGGGVFAVDTAGKVYCDGSLTIGDDANAKMTTGITVNQGAADDEIASFKSSDVAHDFTTPTETDTFLYIKKASATAGGGAVVGLTEATIGLALAGYGTTDDTTHSGAGTAYVVIDTAKLNGNTTGAPGANANIFAVRANNSTKFIIDAEGDLFNDGAALSAYDAHEDGVLASDLADVLLGREAQVSRYDKMALRDLGLISYGADGRVLISNNQSRMLALGAIKQLHGALVAERQARKALEARVVALEAR